MLLIENCKNQNYDGKVHTHGIKWNKVDLNEYEKLVETEMKLKLKQVEALTVSNVNSFVGSICDTLVYTDENLQPKRKSNAKRKCKYMWTPKCQIWLDKQSTSTGNGKRRVAITGKVVVIAK